MRWTAPGSAPRYAGRHRVAALGAALAMLGVAGAPPGASADARTSWQRYVLGPGSEGVLPVRIAATEGRVEHPRRLLRRGAGATTLTMTDGGQPPVIVLDYGKDVGGIPFFDVQAVAGSPTLRASFSESGRFIDADGDNGGEGPCCGNAPPAAEPHRFNEFRPTGPGVLRTTYQQGGERFERIALTAPGQLRLRAAGIDFKAFRATARDYQGWFLSDDRLLNRIWYAGAYTDQLDMVPPGAQNDNPQPAVVDGAKRDRLSWSGDTLIQGPAIWDSLGTNGAPYVEATLLQYADRASPTGALATTVGINTPVTLYFSASYSMHAANAMVDYYRYTGDAGFAERVLPAVRKQLDFDRSLVDDRGLLVTGPPGSRPDVGIPPLCCGLDWDAYDPPKVGAVAAYNVVYYHAVQQAAYLEEHAGDPVRAAALRAQAATLRARINATFFDSSAGLYRVSESIPGIAQDANVLAVLYGVAPDDAVAGILERLKQRLWTTFGARPFSEDTPFSPALSPFVTGLETLTRLSAGDAGDALELMRRHFGRMLDYTGALWEKMAPDGSSDEVTGDLPVDGNSLAHGWATSPLTTLSEHVLGVTPVEPGYAVWRVAPQLGDLRWAQGEVPTPSGPIEVRWSRSRANGGVRLAVRAPAGTRGTIVPPATGGPVRVVVDGEVVPARSSIAVTGR